MEEMIQGSEAVETRSQEATRTQEAPRTPATDRGLIQEVGHGLALPQKTVSSKYFYDGRGSELFEEITRLPEYYLTRAERDLLRRVAHDLITAAGPASLVELGAGSAKKTRILLDAMTEEGRAAVYVPLDVSADFLHETAARLREEYPTLDVRPEVADLTRPLELTRSLPAPSMFALLGSTIGNFDDDEAARLLGRVRGAIRAHDVFLLGVDLRPGVEKSKEDLEAAYNDSKGVTAAFNLNVLSVLNARVGTDFDPARFRHRAFYDDERGRIEMHLESLAPQTVVVPGGPVVAFEKGETLRTEISCKYDRPTVRGLFSRAGFDLTQWWSDADGRYALAIGSPRD